MAEPARTWIQVLEEYQRMADEKRITDQRTGVFGCKKRRSLSIPSRSHARSMSKLKKGDAKHCGNNHRSVL
jgi:hypothetical protein